MQEHKIFLLLKSPSSAKILAGFFMSVVFVFRATFQENSHQYRVNLPKIPQSPVSSGRGCKEYRRSPALKSK